MLIGVGLGVAVFTLHKKGQEQIKSDIQAVKLTAQGEKEDFVYYDGRPYKYREGLLNILCLGVDKNVSMGEEKVAKSMGQSDAIFVASLDQKNKKIRILAVPRESMVPVDVYDTADQYVGTETKQITLQYTYGDGKEKSCELVKDAVSELCFGLPIQRYCSINLNAISMMNDRIGGVPVTLDESIIDWFPYCQIGEQVVLQGDQALEYIQQRNEDVFASSMSRLSRQKNYILSLITQAKQKLSEDITLPVGLFNDLQGNMCTDIQASEITYLATEVLDMSFSEEDLRVVPGDTLMGQQYEEYHVNQEELKSLIIQMFYDEAQTGETSGQN